MGSIQRLSNLSIMLLIVLAVSPPSPWAETTDKRPDPEKLTRMKKDFVKAEQERIAASKRAVEQANAAEQGGSREALKLEPVAPPQAEPTPQIKAKPVRRAGKPTPPHSKRHTVHKKVTKAKQSKRGTRGKRGKTPGTARASLPAAPPRMSEAALAVPARLAEPEAVPTERVVAEPVMPAQLAPGVYTGAADAAALQPEDVRRILADSRDLHGRNMANLVLRGFDFSGANLTDAVLQNADLYHADFSRANLTRANLKGASLERANFSDARMQGAQLSGARLFFANLSGANLENAQLRHCYAPGARLDRANLHNADFRDAILWGAHFEGSSLTGALLDGTVMKTKAPPVPDYVFHP